MPLARSARLSSPTLESRYFIGSALDVELLFQPDDELHLGEAIPVGESLRGDVIGDFEVFIVEDFLKDVL